MHAQIFDDEKKKKTKNGNDHRSKKENTKFLLSFIQGFFFTEVLIDLFSVINIENVFD